MNEKGKIKILQTIRQGQIGGGESHLLDLVENLNKDEFEPIVLSFTDGPMVDRLKQMGIPAHVIYTEKPFDFTVWPKVKQFLIDQKIEMIHAHGTRANSNVLSSARKLNIPVAYTIHGWSFHDDQNFLLKKLRIMGEKYLTNRTNVNISVSQANQDSARKYFSEFKSVIVRYGINQQKFNPNRALKEVRAELGISNDATLVLFVARFTTQKQPLTMAKAFARAVAKNPSLKLLMVGDGDQKSQVHDLVNKLNIGDHIIFQPFRQDVPDVLASADIYVLPSLWEGLPIGLLEAMSMSKAIIASKVDGTSEVIENESNGLLISVDNLEDQLTAAILKLAESKDLRTQLGAKAKEVIREKYSADHMTRQIEDVYRKFLMPKK
jgi:glycosyltransferase involved in cell wall biosynthesis